MPGKARRRQRNRTNRGVKHGRRVAVVGSRIELNQHVVDNAEHVRRLYQALKAGKVAGTMWTPRPAPTKHRRGARQP